MNTTTTSPLSPAERLGLQQLLLRRQAQLDAQLETQQHGQSRAEAAADVLAQDGDDAPQRDADRELSLARNDHDLDELGQVSRALLRIDTPAYGDCVDCAEPIALARLQQIPWTLRCTACAARHEGPAATPARL